MYSSQQFVFFLVLLFRIYENHVETASMNTNTVQKTNGIKFNITEYILNEIIPNNIREHLRVLSEKPHIAGSSRDIELSDYIRDKWTEYGLDVVKEVTYQTLLSYPDNDNPNKVYLLDAEGTVIFTSKHMEDVLRYEDNFTDTVPLFNAYSPNRTVEGELVYAHYAREEDFRTLCKLGINVTGKIVIAKYGKIFRGNKVTFAQDNGALGVILFSDPSEVAQHGNEAEQVYPNTWWLPPSGAQRGTLYTGDGDPATVAYPAIDGVYRSPVESTRLPVIPCQPIGYGDAHELIKILGGLEAPKEWQSPFTTNINVGPQLIANTTARRVRLAVHNQLRTVNTTNVIGIIKGASEPDRYVMTGNHRDAWDMGAVDPSSGTAQMMEVARVFGQLLRKGWRPKRTIIFQSWGAEEYGTIGSSEFVEDNIVKLASRGVAYINIDICTSGDAFYVMASPFLQHFVINITQQISDPMNNSQTLYDSWKQYYSDKAASNQTEELTDGSVKVDDLGGGSDYALFAFAAGVSSVDFTFLPNDLKYKKQLSSYPTYHAAIENFYYVENFLDPKFLRHRACGQLNGILLYNLADADILPFNLTQYVAKIYGAYNRLMESDVYGKLKNHSVNIDHVGRVLQEFQMEADKWMDRLKNTSTSDKDAMRILNDQLTQLDQSFLLPEGLPFHKEYRHLVFSISVNDGYSSSTFPGLQDLMYNIDESTDSEAVWIAVRKHVSDIIVAVHRATKFLQPVHII